MTTVFVTHDVREALRLGDRIAVLHKGEMLQIDTPKNILNSSHELVKDLFGGVKDE